MPAPIVECIANYSEDRRPQVLDAIVESIRAVPNVHLLDRHSDLAHNPADHHGRWYHCRTDLISEESRQAIVTAGIRFIAIG